MANTTAIIWNNMFEVERWKLGGSRRKCQDSNEMLSWEDVSFQSENYISQLPLPSVNKTKLKFLGDVKKKKKTCNFLIITLSKILWLSHI